MQGRLTLVGLVGLFGAKMSASPFLGMIITIVLKTMFDSMQVLAASGAAVRNSIRSGYVFYTKAAANSIIVVASRLSKNMLRAESQSCGGTNSATQPKQVL